MSRFSVVCAAIAAVVLLPLAPSSQAATFCVHDLAELGSALFTAQDNGSADTLELVQGTYTLAQNLDFDSDEAITVSGGWNSDCTLRTANASNTVIFGGDSKFVTLDAGAITIDAVYFQYVPVSEFFAPQIVLRRNRFDSPNVFYWGAVQMWNSSGSVLLDSNLFDGMNVTVKDNDGATDAVADWKIANNTFVGAKKGDTGSIRFEGYGLSLTTVGTGDNLDVVLANNVAWDNDIGGVYFNGAYTHLLAVSNQWQSLADHDGAGLASGSAGNATADPQLDANLHPTEPGSPAINSGTTTVPGGVGAYDVTGGPRIIGTKPDRGAFESSVNDQSVITVTTASDALGNCTGPGDTTCSLRSALTTAAAAGNAQRIVFAIPGLPADGCLRTINVNSALPAVVDTLTIDGYSQPGAQANTQDVGSDAQLCVRLHGNYSVSRGLVADNASSRLDVRGLAFDNFTFAALDISAGAHHVIQGNQFGGPLARDVRGGPLALAGNLRGVYLHGDSSDVLVGGPDAAQRNVIDDSSLYGVQIAGTLASVHTVRNNYIGLTPDGRSGAGNGVGVYIGDYFNIVQDNYIAASNSAGVYVDTGNGQGNALLGNVIGLPAAGSNAVGNGGSGVRLSAACNLVGINLQGFTAPNDIAGNGDGGVVVDSDICNRITANRIHDNAGQNIDLGHDGPTANDATDSDTGANQLQNFPQLLRISHVGDKRVLSGSVYSDNSLRLDVFGAPTCGNSGRGNAAVILSTGSTPLFAPFGGGVINFGRSIARGPGTGIDTNCRLSATVTSANGNDGNQNNNTSELSACFVDDTIFAHGFDGATGWSCAP